MKWSQSWKLCSHRRPKVKRFDVYRLWKRSSKQRKISWQPQVFLTNLKAIQFLRNNHLSVALVPRLVARLNERQELRRRRRSRSCPRCFRLKRHQHLRCQRLQKAPTERQSVFLTVMMMFRCFPFRKCCMLLLLRSNITNLEAFRRLLSKNGFRHFRRRPSNLRWKIIQILNDSGVTRTDLQQAALPMDMSLKMTPSTLHHFVAIGASLTAWLVCEARDHESMNVEVLFSVIDILRSALTHFVHYVPFISKEDQPCGAWAFCMFFCWHVTQLPHWLLVNVATVERIQASLHICTLTRFFNPHMWSLSRCRFTHLTRSGGGTRSPDIFYIGSTAISAVKREFNRLAKLKTNSAQPRSSCRTVNPLYTGAPRQSLNRTRGVLLLQACTPYNVRQCLGPWKFVNQFLATCCESSLHIKISQTQTWRMDAVTKKIAIRSC